MICNECETVAHCSKHGCIPKHPDYEDAIEVSVIFHEGQRMFAVPKQPALFNGWQPAETAPKDARILFLPKMFGNQKEQEPVNICWWSDRDNGWKSDLCNDFGGTEDFDFWMPLPSIQQPAQRKPLTDEEIEEVWQRVQATDFHDCVKPFARAIEAAHGIKENT